MRCELEEDDIGTFPRVTLFTKATAHSIKPTAVYLPPKPAAPGNMLDVVIWLHGFAVRDQKFQEISPTGDHERSRGVSLPEGYSLHDRTGRFFGSVEQILMYGE